MPNSDVLIRFDAQTAQYVQEMLALRQSHEAVAVSATKMADASAKGAEKMAANLEKAKSMAERAGGSFMSMAALGAGAISALNAVGDAYAKQLERIKAGANVTSQKVNTIAGAAWAMWGRAGRSDDVWNQMRTGARTV